MDELESMLAKAARGLSRALEPVVGWIGSTDFAVARALEQVGLAPLWAARVVAGVWLLIVVMVLRVSSGWWRVLLLVAVVAVLAKAYGYLPG